MLDDVEYTSKMLRGRFPRLAEAARSDEAIAHELSELLMFAPAIGRAPRQTVDLTGELIVGDQIVSARVVEMSATGVQLQLSKASSGQLTDMLDACLMLHATDGGAPARLAVRLVRVVDAEPEHLLLGFTLE